MKNKITPEEVKHIAKLANLPLRPSEVKKYAEQLSEVIDYNISLLESVNTKTVEPTAHVLGLSIEARNDEPEPGLKADEAIKNAPSTHNDFFKVPAILENK